jgi:hypothetical protein
MHDKAIKTLKRLYGKIPNYKAEDEYAVILGTVEAEKRWAEANKEIPWLAVVKGINGVSFAIHSNSIQLKILQWRTLISSWELGAGAFVGQSFLATWGFPLNAWIAADMYFSYTIYFFQIAGSTDAFANTCITSGLGIVSVIFLVFGLDYLGRRRIVCYCMSTQWVCLFLIGCIGLVKNPSAGLNGFLIVLACLWCEWSSDYVDTQSSLVLQPCASTLPRVLDGHSAARCPLPACAPARLVLLPVPPSLSASPSDTARLI